VLSTTSVATGMPSALVTLDENGLSTHGARRTRANIDARPT
jgi:hypothetical protein